MKASLFFIVLGITLCTSLWAGGQLAASYVRQSRAATSYKDMRALRFYAVANFFISAAGPITLIILILNKPHK